MPTGKSGFWQFFEKKFRHIHFPLFQHMELDDKECTFGEDLVGASARATRLARNLSPSLLAPSHIPIMTPLLESRY
jgi:hypothetical protein